MLLERIAEVRMAEKAATWYNLITLKIKIGSECFFIIHPHTSEFLHLVDPAILE
jgi:hypothetical protein